MIIKYNTDSSSSISIKSMRKRDVKNHNKKMKKERNNLHSNFELNNFKGVNGDFLSYNNKIFMGISGIKDSDGWRELGFELTKFLKSKKIKEVSVQAPNGDEFLEGMLLGDYEFKVYKSNKPNKEEPKIIVNFHSNLSEDRLKEIETSVYAQYLTKSLVNRSPQDANSQTIEDLVTTEFLDSPVEIEVLDERDLARLGMRGHLAVNRASANPAKVIKLSYTPKKPNQTIALIGKGLTFDSGGLNIKPGKSMSTMKSDKAGAMTLIGLMMYVKYHGSPNKIVCYLSLAENMISSNAYRPDDVLTMKNGKTVHVKI